VRPVRAGGDTRRVYYERDEDACRAASDAIRDVLA
jgi:hypothetical protein